MRLYFWGAAETVTGSKYLVETNDSRVLVDCGLFQGLKKLREKNWRELDIAPSELDAVVLTHAHIDHTGYLPRLVKQGFDGAVYCTSPTRDLLGIMLPDAGYLQEEQARYANRKSFTKHDPAEPLYDKEEAEESLEQLMPVEFGEEFKPADGVSCELTPSGHILGAGWLRLRAEGREVVFSGDVGRPNDMLMAPPHPLDSADYLIGESTYGDRTHPRTSPWVELADVLRRTIQRGGITVIPAFAVGRSQTLMHMISTLIRGDQIPDVPVYLNSPMAISVTDLYVRHQQHHRLSRPQCREMCEEVEFTNSVPDSKRLNHLEHPAIILAGSGMATGGRVIHHLKAYGPEAKNTILFAGFQAAGTRGEAMLAGANEVKIHGEYVPIRAEVVELDGLSAHGDYVEIGDWLQHMDQPPQRTFLTHGEPSATDAMRRYLRDRFGWDCEQPELDEVVELS